MNPYPPPYPVPDIPVTPVETLVATATRFVRTVTNTPVVLPYTPDTSLFGTGNTAVQLTQLAPKDEAAIMLITFLAGIAIC